MAASDAGHVDAMADGERGGDVTRERLGPDVDCVLCHRLLYEPVSLACGHSFCKGCLERALRYNSHCPNCRAPVHYDSVLPVSICLRSVLETALPAEYAERRAEALSEASEAADGAAWRLPLFVLTAVVFPGGHERYCIFEPRYRLMLRRVMQGSRRFGIVSLRRSDADASVALCNVGCVLEVTKCLRMTEDRYIIDTVGRDRFTILDTEVVDEYLVAQTRKLVDNPETPGSDDDGAPGGADAARRRSEDLLSNIGSTVGSRSSGSLDFDPPSRADSGGGGGGGGGAAPRGGRGRGALRVRGMGRGRVAADPAGNAPPEMSAGVLSALRPTRRTASVAAYARRLVREVIAGNGSGGWTGPTVANVLRAAGPPPGPEEGATKLGMWLADRLITDVNQRQTLLEETDPAARLIAISLILERANSISVPTGGFAGGCVIS